MSGSGAAFTRRPGCEHTATTRIGRPMANPSSRSARARAATSLPALHARCSAGLYL